MTECKQRIAVDADMHPTALKMTAHGGKKCELVLDESLNDYQHNSGVPSSEVFSHEQFISQLKSENKALVCCDGKGDSEVIFDKQVNVS